MARSTDVSSSGSNNSGSGRPESESVSEPEGLWPFVAHHMRELLTSPCWAVIWVWVMLISIGNVATFSPCGEEPLRIKVINNCCFTFFLVNTIMEMVLLRFSEEGVNLRCVWTRIELVVLVIELVDYVLFVFRIFLRISYPLKVIRLVLRVKGIRRWLKAFMDISPAIICYLRDYLLLVYIFGCIGRDLWEGDLHHRCFMSDLDLALKLNMSPYYESSPAEYSEFLCSPYPEGPRQCKDIPPLRRHGQTCMLDPASVNWSSAILANSSALSNSTVCVNWNVLYNACLPQGPNPEMGGISFDSLGEAMLTVFQVTTLSGWTTIMCYVVDVSSMFSIVYFLILVILGCFIFLNVSLAFVSFNMGLAIEDDPNPQRGFFLDLLDLLHRMKLYRKEHPIFRVLSESNRWWSNESRSRSYEFLSPVQEVAERLINSSLANCFMMLTVIANTIVLCLDNYDMSEAMTNALMTCNYVFIAVYLLEAVLLLCIFRLSYFTDWRNLVDIAILIIGLVDISTDMQGLNSVGLLRLVRLYKILDLMPNVKRALWILKRSIRKSIHLFMLLLATVFGFGIWGMTLFHCVTFPPPEVGVLFSEEANFNDLYWAMLTAFKIMTKDGWTGMMYIAMVKTSPYIAFYFITVIIVGKNVIMTTVVGAVVEGFKSYRMTHSQSDDSRLESLSDRLSASLSEFQSSTSFDSSPIVDTPSGGSSSWPSKPNSAQERSRQRRSSARAQRRVGPQSDAGTQSDARPQSSAETQSDARPQSSAETQSDAGTQSSSY